MRLGFSYFVSPFLAFLPAFLLVSLHAQSAVTGSQPPAPSFKTNAQAVSVDVVVTASNGQPILALGRQDFELLEDGKPQAIDLFEEHSAAGAPAAPLPQLPPHVYTNQPAAPQSDSVNVLLLDNLNTPEPDQAYVHKQIIGFLKNLQPGTRIAIFSLNTKLRLLQGFTADSSQLKAAIDSKAAAPGTTPVSRTRDDDLRDKEELSIIGEMSNTGGGDAEAPLQAVARSLADWSTTQAGQRAALTLAALQQLARSLAAIPGRKNLIWFASSFPVSIFPSGPNRQTLSNGKEIGDAVRQTANLLTQAKVALYPVSAQGILLDRTTNADSAGQPSGDDFERTPLQEAPANAANTAAMEQLASDTGGQAFYTSNNLSESITSAIQNGSHFYTLVYTPPDRHLDGKFHRIQVLLKPDRLAQDKSTLSYRRGYYADDTNSPQPIIPADPLAPLLARGLPASTQVLYQARVLSLAPQPAPGSLRAGGNVKLTGSFTRYKVDFVINAKDVAFDPGTDGNHVGKIEVALVAYDQAGNVLNWTGNTLAISLSAASYVQVASSGIPVHLQIDLPPTEVSLATGVYDFTAHKAGTLEITLHPESAETAPSAAPQP